jgi:hypothetical protein
MRKLLLGLLLFGFTVLFSCSNPAVDRNAKMTEFIDREKNIQYQMDSLLNEMNTSSFIDTFVLEQVTTEVEAMRITEENRKMELSNRITKLKEEIINLKISIDSLTKMK